MTDEQRARLKQLKERLPRMWDWMALTVALFGMVAFFAPQQLNVVLYKALLVSIAAVLTFWVDRSIFKRVADRIEDLRSDDIPTSIYQGARILARALMFVGCALGMTLGL